MDQFHREVSQSIMEHRYALAEAMVEQQHRVQPELGTRYVKDGREKYVQDALSHLSYLAQAIAMSRPGLFGDYIAWAKVVQEGYKLPADVLEISLKSMRDALQQTLPAAMSDIVLEYIEVGLQQVQQSSVQPPSFILPEQPHAQLARQFLDALLRCERNTASRLIMDAVKAGVSIKDLYLHVFQCSQYEIGRLWELNRLSVAQEHYCTAATQLIMSQLYPYIFTTPKNGYRMVATCVSGDYHEIGIRMVSDFFEMEGWDTFYLGANTPTPSLVQTMIDLRPHVLAVSATMTLYVQTVADLIAAVRANEATAGVKILVGGYPFNIAPDLWREIGADGCGGTAIETIEIARRLVMQGGQHGSA